VLASVLSLLLVAFGLVSFERLPLRQYPDTDPPIVSVETLYPGAAATVVENRITQLIEDRIAGIEGIKTIESASEDGRSRVTVEFEIDRDIDGAANDIRDRVSSVLDQLPAEADPPEIQKVDSNEDVILWLNLTSERMTVPELTDYAERYLVDRFSVLDGVARVRLGGSQIYAMRIWLDRNALAARGITVSQVEDALRAENLELPAGSVESRDRQLSVRVKRPFNTAGDFAKLVLARGVDGYLVRLADVARVERATAEDRTLYRGNGMPMVGIGIIKQSTANTVAVAEAAKAEAGRINPRLPKGMEIKQSYDTSVFIKEAIREVYKTLGIAIILVVAVIFLFLGSLRATLIPAVTVPVSVTATFIVLLALGFSINMLTLLALVLAIGLVVDDAIVVLENVHRRMESFGESRLVAAYRGTRQVGFAVIATTLVLAAVFVPIAFLRGDLGRLFAEFALTMSAAVLFSAFVALSLSAMLASQVLPKIHQERTAGGLPHRVDRAFRAGRRLYTRLLRFLLGQPWILALGLLGTLAAVGWLLKHIPSEYTPKEDRGAFTVLVNGPEGASHAYMREYMEEIERRLLPYAERGEAMRILVRSPRAFGTTTTFNDGMVILVLNDFARRRSAWVIMDEIRADLAELPGVRASPVMRQGFGNRTRKPIQLVIGGGSYEELAAWRDRLIAEIEKDNPGLTGIDWDYKETKPQLQVAIDYDRAADLGVSVGTVGRTLETMLGSRKVTTYLDNGEEYDVILEGEREQQRAPDSLERLYVASARSGALIPLASLVDVSETAQSRSLNRFNRVRAITIDADLAKGLALGDALGYLEGKVREHLPEQARLDYKGQSRDFRASGEGMLFVFALGILVVYLVLAAQFESWVQPLVIMLTVPLAMAGALAGLWVSDQTLNIYSQIGLIMLIGLSAKNGILIVELANQSRDLGVERRAALIDAAEVRLRPILMTGITTAAGAVPLVLAEGAGAESRAVIGIVVLAGVVAATFFTLFVVPIAYDLLAKRSASPGAVRSRLERALSDEPSRAADGVARKAV
jgi:multidrug efflux pump